MATTVTPGRTQPEESRGGHNPPHEDGGGGDRRPFRRDPRTHTMGVGFAVAGIGMLFMALTSSYVVRQGLGMDWQRLPMPRILLVNSALLLISSITIERARLAVRNGDQQGSGTWVWVTLMLGLGFLCGQVLAWRSLANRGFFLSTNPHSSFFYVLTGLHGAHLAGGLLALTYVAIGPFQQLRMPAAAGFSGWSDLATHRRNRWLEGTAVYWHFMDALWIYLLVLLFVWG
jgi:cytochrome c oxidase subunit III